MTLEIQIKSIKEDESKVSLENPVNIISDPYRSSKSLEQPLCNVSLNRSLEYGVI